MPTRGGGRRQKRPRTGLKSPGTMSGTRAAGNHAGRNSMKNKIRQQEVLSTEETRRSCLRKPRARVRRSRGARGPRPPGSPLVIHPQCGRHQDLFLATSRLPSGLGGPPATAPHDGPAPSGRQPPCPLPAEAACQEQSAGAGPGGWLHRGGAACQQPRGAGTPSLPPRCSDKSLVSRRGDPARPEPRPTAREVVAACRSEPSSLQQHCSRHR